MKRNIYLSSLKLEEAKEVYFKHFDFSDRAKRNYFCRREFR